MEAASELGYQVVISEESVERIAGYKADLINGKAKAGKHLKKGILGLDLNTIGTCAFIQLLLSTKKPRIFAELHVSCDGRDWSSREFSMLGDIGIAVKAVAYDNGDWDEKVCTKHDSPLDVELLFTPGPLLHTGSTGPENNPDYKEVVGDGKINQEKYNALVERRLRPLLSYVNNQAESGKNALVVLPGIGCGCFAGRFEGQMERRLDEALRALIEKHKFPNIKGIHLGLHEVRLNVRKEINGVLYEVRGSGLPQLSHPQKYGAEFEDCKLYKVVAWDHVSLPGNDFFGNNTRYTDDGVAAAATNSMEVITGFTGTYKKGKYFPPKEYSDWEMVAKLNGVKLVANKNNVKIVTRDGQIYSIQN